MGCCVRVVLIRVVTQWACNTIVYILGDNNSGIFLKQMLLRSEIVYIYNSLLLSDLRGLFWAGNDWHFELFLEDLKEHFMSQDMTVVRTWWRDELELHHRCTCAQPCPLLIHTGLVSLTPAASRHPVWVRSGLALSRHSGLEKSGPRLLSACWDYCHECDLVGPNGQS